MREARQWEFYSKKWLYLAIVCADNETGVVRQVACEAVRGGLEVALMASQIYQGHHLGGSQDVVGRGGRAEHGVIQNLPPAIQLHREPHPSYLHHSHGYVTCFIED